MRQLFIFVAFIVLASISFPSTSVTGCRNITNAAGSPYILANNISGANLSNACIWMWANNTVLDCNGFWIKSNSSNQIGIMFPKYVVNATIINCNIYNYSYGLETGLWIVHLNLTNNTVTLGQYGFYIFASGTNDNDVMAGNTANNSTDYGFYFYGSSLNLSFYNNSANNNGVSTGDAGIYFNSMTNSTVYNNIASNNYQHGIRVDNSHYNVFYNNTVHDNTQTGFYLNSNSYNNTLHDNIAQTTPEAKVSFFLQRLTTPCTTTP